MDGGKTCLKLSKTGAVPKFDILIEVIIQECILSGVIIQECNLVSNFLPQTESLFGRLSAWFLYFTQREAISSPMFFSPIQSWHFVKL